MTTSVRRALVTGATRHRARHCASAAAQGVQVLITGAMRAAEKRSSLRSAPPAAAPTSPLPISHPPTRCRPLPHKREASGRCRHSRQQVRASIHSSDRGDDSRRIRCNVQLNVKAPLLLTAVHRVEDGASAAGGRIVNVTTMVAYIGMAGAALYGSFQGGVAVAHATWAAEYGGGRVTANAIAPALCAAGTAGMSDALDQIGKTVPAAESARPRRLQRSPHSSFRCGQLRERCDCGGGCGRVAFRGASLFVS
jgi:NAD(P)-dependent dehydrogenase (short-subunit alcohol dehydrogenase family)